MPKALLSTSRNPSTLSSVVSRIGSCGPYTLWHCYGFCIANCCHPRPVLPHSPHLPGLQDCISSLSSTRLSQCTCPVAPGHLEGLPIHPPHKDPTSAKRAITFHCSRNPSAIFFPSCQLMSNPLAVLGGGVISPSSLPNCLQLPARPVTTVITSFLRSLFSTREMLALSSDQTPQ